MIATQYPAETRAQLTQSRVKLAADIAEAFGTTRNKIRLPHGYAVLYRADGARLADWADDQAVHVGRGAYIRPSADVLRAVEGHSA